ncbi:hypothetical protein DY000_02008989 [Brassica cretica]|uniref:Uncharacterized protein n=1 Tax=Brassica cretica TaxID=69181 RepID=A0ABQ7CG65_BRACR|nr:hypothetical protein DY000_02008989 [Brassica cretica]
MLLIIMMQLQGTLVPATVNASHVPTFRPHLTAGAMYSFHKRLEAMRGTHMYFDKQTNVGENYFYKLVPTDTGLPSAAPLLRGYAKVQTLTISELNEFIITALTQDIDFISTRKVTSVKIEIKDGVLLLAPIVPKKTAARRCRYGRKNIHLSGDNNNGPAGDDTVIAKVETGGSSEQSSSNTGTAPTGDEQKTPPENASLKMVKKALMS